ncbi:MAG TPA: ABC transporter substrate-binding protein [Hyphomicrobiaceae bacterium]|nr:ABC transporter substrate-binding protein [Hyphomicrobiaceae bacterium]
MPVIGFLNSGSAGGREQLLAAFRQGLAETGHAEGRNVTIEFRWAEGHYERLPELAADLVRRRVGVIAATGGTVAPLAAKDATATVPIVCVFDGDPVAFGLVASINRPGGNVTGISLVASIIEAKQLELLHELVPNAGVIAILVNPNNSNAKTIARDLQAATRTRGLEPHVLDASREPDFEAVSETLDRLRPSALVVATDPFFLDHRDRLVALTARHAIPTVFGRREFAVLGGLISYGTSLADTYRQIGVYAGRILKGTKPADLPVMQPTKFELVINLKTAKTLGLTVPLTLQAAADEVIE